MRKERLAADKRAADKRAAEKLTAAKLATDTGKDSVAEQSTTVMASSFVSAWGDEASGEAIVYVPVYVQRILDPYMTEAKVIEAIQPPVLFM
jgi:hypothetical protein